MLISYFLFLHIFHKCTAFATRNKESPILNADLIKYINEYTSNAEKNDAERNFEETGPSISYNKFGTNKRIDVNVDSRYTIRDYRNVQGFNIGLDSNPITKAEDVNDMSPIQYQVPVEYHHGHGGWVPPIEPIKEHDGSKYLLRRIQEANPQRLPNVKEKTGNILTNKNVNLHNPSLHQKHPNVEQTHNKKQNVVYNIASRPNINIDRQLNPSSMYLENNGNHLMENVKTSDSPAVDTDLPVLEIKLLVEDMAPKQNDNKIPNSEPTEISHYVQENLFKHKQNRFEIVPKKPHQEVFRQMKNRNNQQDRKSQQNNIPLNFNPERLAEKFVNRLINKIDNDRKPMLEKINKHMPNRGRMASTSNNDPKKKLTQQLINHLMKIREQQLPIENFNQNRYESNTFRRQNTKDVFDKLSKTNRSLNHFNTVKSKNESDENKDNMYMNTLVDKSESKKDNLTQNEPSIYLSTNQNNNHPKINNQNAPKLNAPKASKETLYRQSSIAPYKSRVMAEPIQKLDDDPELLQYFRDQLIELGYDDKNVEQLWPDIVKLLGSELHINVDKPTGTTIENANFIELITSTKASSHNRDTTITKTYSAEDNVLKKKLKTEVTSTTLDKAQESVTITSNNKETKTDHIERTGLRQGKNMVFLPILNDDIVLVPVKKHELNKKTGALPIQFENFSYEKVQDTVNSYLHKKQGSLRGVTKTTKEESLEYVTTEAHAIKWDEDIELYGYKPQTQDEVEPYKPLRGPEIKNTLKTTKPNGINMALLSAKPLNIQKEAITKNPSAILSNVETEKSAQTERNTIKIKDKLTDGDVQLMRQLLAGKQLLEYLEDEKSKMIPKSHIAKQKENTRRQATEKLLDLNKISDVSLLTKIFHENVLMLAKANISQDVNRSGSLVANKDIYDALKKQTKRMGKILLDSRIPEVLRLKLSNIESIVKLLEADLPLEIPNVTLIQDFTEEPVKSRTDSQETSTKATEVIDKKKYLLKPDQDAIDFQTERKMKYSNSGVTTYKNFGKILLAHPEIQRLMKICKPNKECEMTEKFDEPNSSSQEQTFILV